MQFGSLAKIGVSSVFLCSCMMIEANSFSTKNLTVYSDSQWQGIRLYDNCNMRRKTNLAKRLHKGKDEDRRYLRFTLQNGQKGACGSDSKARNGAPFWERAELKQTDSLNKDSHYQLSFDMRIVEGFTGAKETFLQLHGWSKQCPGGPPLRFMMDNGKLSIQPRVKGGYSAPAHTGHEISEFLGKWRKFRVEFSTFEQNRMKLFIDDTLAIETEFDIASCAEPHLKIGIYRAGNLTDEGNATSIVDFSKFRLRQITP